MGLTRQEVNLRRLLAKCELMCKENKKSDERMPKYVDSLENMYQEVKKLSDSNEFLTTYERRISSLKFELGIITSKYQRENQEEAQRESLLGLRHRQVPNELVSDDKDEIIRINEKLQSKITEEMLALTSNLKEQSKIANQIIRNDTKTMENSAHITEQNYSKLQSESTKLTEYSKRAWKCWMWLMLAVVVVIFINMVLFMKVMKKSK